MRDRIRRITTASFRRRTRVMRPAAPVAGWSADGSVRPPRSMMPEAGGCRTDSRPGHQANQAFSATRWSHMS